MVGRQIDDPPLTGFGEMIDRPAPDELRRGEKWKKQMTALPLPPPPPPGDLLDTNALPPDWVRMALSTWSPPHELLSRALPPTAT